MTLIAAALASPRLDAANHPLDPLDQKEILAAVDALWKAGRVNKDSRFSIVKLAEPDKQAVLAWEPGTRVPRRAFAAIRHERKLYEAVIDIGGKEVLSWEQIEDAQPAQIADEWLLSQQIVRQDQAWRAAIRKRGIKDPKSLLCVPSLPGYFGPEEDRSRRLGKVACYDGRGDGNLWGRPLEGLVATVDFDDERVVDLYDAGPVSMGDGGPPVADKTGVTIPALGPRKKRFRIDGHVVEWGMWRFHVHVDPRTGPVLSRVAVRDDEDRMRSVVYRAEAAEMFVPYMDPDKPWYYRAFLDIGEYGIGASGTPLRAGRDCPQDSTMLDAIFTDHMGRPYEKEGLVCIFERATGDVAWSHYEIARNRSRSNRHDELVVRFVVWLGNYDYVLEWIFTRTGSLKGRVGATGVVQAKGVASESMDSSDAAKDTAYGRLILPHTVAVNHDHFFAFRLDMDVDGTANSLSIDRLERVEVDPEESGTPLTSIWQVRPRIAAAESEAKLTIDPRRPALWRVLSSTTKNPVGNPTSIHLRPGAPGLPLVDPESRPQTRAAFTNYHLWVTPYDPDERYPAGEYPNQHPGGAGLPDWTRNDRPIENTDIVLWYTIGMHHVVRAEDWPLMPVVHHEFELRPFDFFAQNPDVPTAR
jgi:primary-amine oxidase